MTAIEFTGRETRTLDKTFRDQTGQLYEFTLIDPDGRRLHTQMEELTVSEEGCTGQRITATVGLPDAGSEAALALLRALMSAMGVDDYELTPKTQTSI